MLGNVVRSSYGVSSCDIIEASTERMRQHADMLYPSYGILETENMTSMAFATEGALELGALADAIIADPSSSEELKNRARQVFMAANNARFEAVSEISNEEQPEVQVDILKARVDVLEKQAHILYEAITSGTI
jgi:hypothetical protein